MLCSPLPPLAASLGKLEGLFAMLLVVVAPHIYAIFLHIVAVVAESVHVLIRNLYSCLYQLVILVVAHSQRGIERTRHKQVDVLGKAYKLVVKMVHDAHADGQLSEAYTPDAYTCALMLKRVLVLGCHYNHCIVHRRLQDVYQWHTVANYLERLT